MEHRQGLAAMLELSGQPAFLVRDGTVQSVNRAAAARLIAAGTPVLSLISAGAEEYAAFREGTLCLSLTVEGVRCEATVSPVEDCHLFVLADESRAAIQSLALAARQLREPLSSALAISEEIQPDAVSAGQIAGINRALYRILRTVSNMSDADTADSGQMELRDVPDVVTEIFSASREYCLAAGVSLEFENQVSGVYSLIDTQKLERGIYNILSNSLKFTPKGGRIRAKLTRRGNTVYLTVTDSGSGLSLQQPNMLFEQYQRRTGLEDPRHGLGLGLTILRSAAAVHGGTVLMEQTRDSGVRTTLSLPIRQNGTALQSPRIPIDYAGERDHALVELSDTLPNDLYTPDRL